jgi:uncharacterized membrane protein YfhO
LPSTIFGSTVNLNVPGHAVYDGNRIRFKATTAYDAPLYFSLSSAYPRESTVSITANGTTLTYPLYEDSDADSTVTVPLGSYAADTLVEISINFQNSADGRFYLPDNTPLLWQENPTATRRAVSILKSRAATDFRFSGNRLSATVTTNGESAILTTLPYDYRIAVTLDGKKVETVSALGAFLAIPVSGDGEHQITLTLSAPVSTAPMVLSFLGAAMLASLAVLELLVYRGRLTLPYLSARKEERDAEVDES